MVFFMIRLIMTYTQPTTVQILFL